MDSVKSWMTLAVIMILLSVNLAVAQDQACLQTSQEMEVAIPSRTTCHQGRCKKQHKPVNRQSILRELHKKTLEKDKPVPSKLIQPPEPRGSQRQESTRLSTDSPRVSLEELGKDPACETFSKVCKDRVALLESYRKEADSIIESQERKIVEVKEEKRKFPWVHVTISVLVGALTGVILL